MTNDHTSALNTTRDVRPTAALIRFHIDGMKAEWRTVADALIAVRDLDGRTATYTYLTVPERLHGDATKLVRFLNLTDRCTMGPPPEGERDLKLIELSAGSALFAPQVLTE